MHPRSRAVAAPAAPARPPSPRPGPGSTELPRPRSCAVTQNGKKTVEVVYLDHQPRVATRMAAGCVFWSPASASP